MPNKLFWGLSAISFTILIWLTLLASISQTTALQIPTGTPGPTPTQRPQEARQSTVRNGIQALQLNAPYDPNVPPCQAADAGISIWHNLQAVGASAQVSSFSRDPGVMLRITDNFFPAICSSNPINAATATHLDTGTTLNALIWEYDPLAASSFLFEYQGSPSRFYVAQLPMDAYALPGNWQLRVTSPQTLEVTIPVGRPQSPSAILDGSGGYLVMGLQPDEHVLGFIFNGFGDNGGLIDHFELIANPQGIARYTSSVVYWNVITPDATSSLMLLVGDAGSGLYYPLGQDGVFIFTTDGSPSPANLNGDFEIRPSELIEYMRRLYWGAAAPAGNSACALPARLVVGERGRVPPGDANNLRADSSTGAARIGSIPGGAEFSVLSGPVCNQGYQWWRVNYNGQIGWTAEGGNGSYWIEPITSSSVIPSPTPAPVTFTRNLFFDSPTMFGEDVRAVQTRLIELGYNPGPIDDIYGPRTEAAVREYQRDQGLVVDGIVGPITWNSLFP